MGPSTERYSRSNKTLEVLPILFNAYADCRFINRLADIPIFNTKVHMYHVSHSEDPMMVLMEFMRIQNLRLVDLFTSLDKDGSKSLTRREFRDGLLVTIVTHLLTL